MNRFAVAVPSHLFLLAGLFAVPAQAAFHFWDITEVYSNEDGSVQFIELFTTSGSQQSLDNHTIVSTSTVGGTPTINTFTFQGNLSLLPPNPFSTANQHMLIATAGFGGLPGGVTPDYTLTADGPLFNPNADSVTLNFANFDVVSFPLVPTNGINSLNYPGATVAVNSPTNFMGDVGSLVSPGLPGDYNDDDIVNAADFTTWRDTLGQTAVGLPADGDLSGMIDAGDYTVWKNNFGNVAAALGFAKTADVPEPTSVLLLLSFVAAVFSFRAMHSSRSCRAGNQS